MFIEEFQILFASDGTYSVLEVDKKTYCYRIKASKLDYNSSLEYLEKLKAPKD